MTNRQFIKPIVERKKRYENIYTPIFYKAIQRTKEPVLKIAKEHGVLTALTATRLITGEHFKAAAISLYTTIGPKEAKWLYKELNKTKDVKAGFGFDFNFFTDIVDFLNRKILDKLVTELTETTRNRIYRTIVDGTRDGDSYDEIIKRLEDTELDKSRARLIARTETNRAVNAGHDMGRKAYPYEVDKIWLSARDRRTRGADGEDKADHFHMNEQTVGEEEAFTDHRANVQLMYPGDSSLGATAATIVNCRCNVRFNPKRDANGRLILRQGRVNIPSIPTRSEPLFSTNDFIPAKTILEAQKRAKDIISLSYGSEPSLNEYNSILRAIHRTQSETDKLKIRLLSNQEMDFMAGQYTGKDKIDINIDLIRLYNEKGWGDNNNSGRQGLVAKSFDDVLVHEIGHNKHINYTEKKGYESDPFAEVFGTFIKISKSDYTNFEDYAQSFRKVDINDLKERWDFGGFYSGKLKDEFKELSVSEYGTKNLQEFIAELYTAYKKGDNIPIQLQDFIKKVGKK